MEIVEFQDVAGHSPFAEWFDDLDVHAARKVTAALTRIALGNLGVTKSVGGGILECKIDFGPVYRLYFGRDGEQLVILLAGGTKRRQKDDIVVAQARWADYERRRKGAR
ncbi:MAG: type II toxin-antitoxin system RelE/ParE family toxin [Janthinobacterium lividum]